MRIKGYDVNRSSIASFLRGNATMIASELNILKLELHEKQQIHLRHILCNDCALEGACQVCKCKTPNLFFDLSKVDSRGRWGKILDKTQWETLMGKTIKKNTRIEDAGESLDKLSARNLKKLAASYTKFYLEEADDMVFILESDDIEHDLGNVELNSATDLIFHLKNTLSFPIQISKVIAGCGCTQPSWSGNQIQPDENFNIGVRFEARSLGKAKKHLSVIYTDDRIISTTLTIKANIVLKSQHVADMIDKPGIADETITITLDKEYFPNNESSLSDKIITSNMLDKQNSNEG